MGKIIAGLIGLIIGAVGGMSLGGGAMMGAGVATGLSAGICATVQAAQEEGLMTAEQVDQVLTRAAQDLGSTAQLDDEAAMVGSADQCQSVMDNLTAAGG
ncbi:hypothetical protein [Roseovarius aestuariivivens]|uniref:hypothetical protein n=1 Tax=Roseovarius aestuariivivens TaxID=1888910 RepID=UPI00108204D9|nr:hypothetical protein [Roseovarius aestuariivivens]